VNRPIKASLEVVTAGSSPPHSSRHVEAQKEEGGISETWKSEDGTLGGQVRLLGKGWCLADAGPLGVFDVYCCI
jgi:hypothetical protein